jgi:hypothetical protein
VNSCSFLEQRETLVAHTRALFECRDSSGMFQSVIEQIGPPVMCAEFADDCIDGNVVLIAIGVILGSIMGLPDITNVQKRSQQLTFDRPTNLLSSSVVSANHICDYVVLIILLSARSPSLETRAKIKSSPFSYLLKELILWLCAGEQYPQ